GHSDGHSDAYCDSDRDAYCDRDRDAHSDCDGDTYSDRDGHAHCDSDGHAHCDSHGPSGAHANGGGNRGLASAYSHADADAHADTSTHAGHPRWSAAIGRRLDDIVDELALGRALPERRCHPDAGGRGERRLVVQTAKPLAEEALSPRGEPAC
ncbi:MAG: hypothetical protein Q8P22_07755, partial [Chloroflexota bacterium]|nr:hypothetical protein [Chloroflexota bacterium]